jgi:hypothetical protein
MRTYFYNYHEDYGSPKYDNRPVTITAARVSADRKSVQLTLDVLEAWRLYDLTMTGIVSDDGQHPLLSNWVVYTLNHLRKNTPPPPAPIARPPTQRRTPRFPSTNMLSIGGPQNFQPLPPMELLVTAPPQGPRPVQPQPQPQAQPQPQPQAPAQTATPAQSQSQPRPPAEPGQPQN